mgnify:CR=1 FL=1
MKSILYPLAILGLTALPAAAQDARPDTTGWFANPGKLTQADGETVYRAICAACHMPEGQGAVGAGHYPALADNEMLSGADYPVHVVTHGQKGMPAIGEMLDDEQIAAVVNYIRTHFGNDYPEDPATAETVAAAR